MPSNQIESEDLDQAVQHLQAEARHYDILAIPLSLLGVVVTVIGLILGQKLPNMPSWFGSMFMSLFFIYFAASIYCMGYLICLNKIIGRCKTDTLLPVPQLFIKAANKRDPNIVKSLDKPIG